jgi:hypothetical protein
VIKVVAAIVESILGVFHGLLSEFTVVDGKYVFVDLLVVVGDNLMHFCAANVCSCEVDANNAET